MNIQNLYRPLALLSIVSLVLATTFTGGSASAESSDADVPPGQLTRRGVSGTVAAVKAGSIIVSTKFGNVTIGVGDGTIIKSRGEIIDLVDINVGDRAGVLLDKAPDAPKDPDEIDLSALEATDDSSPTVTPVPQSDDTSPTVTPVPQVDDTSATATPEPTETPTPEPTATSTPEPTATPTAIPTATPPANADDTSPTPTPDVSTQQQVDDSGFTPTPTPPTLSDDTSPSPPAIATLVPLFRQNVTALRISIVPSQATRSHECVVVTETGDGTTTVLDADGNEIELEGDEGT